MFSVLLSLYMMGVANNEHIINNTSKSSNSMLKPLRTVKLFTKLKLGVQLNQTKLNKY